MPTILCYGDSNTWGHDPATGSRFPADVRWPCVLRRHLPAGHEVIEEGLPGRTTLWDDPFMEKRSGLEYLVPCLASHAPVDLVALMLGTNDLKAFFQRDAAQIASGVSRLLEVIASSAAGPGGAPPRVLLIAPAPVIQGSRRAELWGFAGAPERGRGLADFLRMVADDAGCPFLDAGEIVACSPIDGIHLDAAAHQALGRAVAERVIGALAAPGAP
jgi:lysophospholipase L1-like esterase